MYSCQSFLLGMNTVQLFKKELLLLLKCLFKKLKRLYLYNKDSRKQLLLLKDKLSFRVTRDVFLYYLLRLQFQVPTQIQSISSSINFHVFSLSTRLIFRFLYNQKHGTTLYNVYPYIQSTHGT